MDNKEFSIEEKLAKVVDYDFKYNKDLENAYKLKNEDEIGKILVGFEDYVKKRGKIDSFGIKAIKDSKFYSTLNGGYNFVADISFLEIILKQKYSKENSQRVLNLICQMHVQLAKTTLTQYNCKNPNTGDQDLKKFSKICLKVLDNLHKETESENNFTIKDLKKKLNSLYKSNKREK